MRKLKTILVAALAATMVISSMTMAAMASDSKDISVTVKDLSQDWGKEPDLQIWDISEKQTMSILA